MPIPKSFVVVAAAMLAGASAPSLAANRSLDEFTPSPLAELVADAEDGQLDDISLARAAIVAGGLHDRWLLEQALDRLQQLHAGLPEYVATVGTPRERMATIFTYLHEHVLTGNYDPHCSRLDMTLREGNFNCLTASILYRAFCESQGITVDVMAEADHVYCRFGDSCYIETTARDGFDVIETDNRRAAGPLSGEPRSRPVRTATAISDVQLIAKVFYNQGRALFQENAFSEALPPLRIAYHWDTQHAAARTTLLACLNNGALAFSSSGRFDRAVQWLVEGQELAPEDPNLLQNDVHVHHRWVRILCEQEEYGRALQILEAGYQRRPSVALFDEGRQIVREFQDG